MPYRSVIRLCRCRMTLQKPPLQSMTTTALHPFGKAFTTASTIRVPHPLTADVISQNWISLCSSSKISETPTAVGCPGLVTGRLRVPQVSLEAERKPGVTVTIRTLSIPARFSAICVTTGWTGRARLLMTTSARRSAQSRGVCISFIQTFRLQLVIRHSPYPNKHCIPAEQNHHRRLPIAA